jgi:hypothetical protein
MKQLIDVAKTGGDKAGLQRFGIIVDFSTSMRGMEASNPMVGHQDAVMEGYWKLAWNVIATRASSMSRHTAGFPCMLAGLLHPEEAKANTTWQTFKELVEAFEVAGTKTQEKTCQIVASSPLGSTVMQFAVKFAKAGQWERVTGQLMQLLEALFKGFGQTKVVEDSIKELRDKEQRVAPSKQLAHFMEWQTCVDAKLLEKYGRDEVEASGASLPSDDFDADAIFQVCHKSSGEQDSVDLRSITKKMTWTTWTSQSIKNSFSDLQLLLYMHKTGSWDLVGSAWHVSFLPVGQVLQDEDANELFMVLKIFSGAALVWPLAEAGTNLYQLDLGARLQWKVVLTNADIVVLPTRVVSPLHGFLRKLPDLAGFPFGVTGKKVDYLKWQAQQGFAGVPEQALKKLCEDRDLTGVPDPALTDHSAADQMALALMMLLLPNLDQHVAQNRMFKRRLQQDELAMSYLDDMSEDMIMDVVLAGDQQDAKGFIQKREQAQARRVATAATVRKTVEHFYQVKMPNVKKAATKAQQKVEAKRLEQKKARFYADLAANAVQTLHAEKPAVAKVFVDDPNGRFRLFYKPFHDRSISWTTRGQADAVLMSLRQLWAWNATVTGEGAPAHLGL